MEFVKNMYEVDKFWIYELVTSTYTTNRCKFPCSMCMCPMEELVNVQRTFDYRTEPTMKVVYNQMMEASPSRHNQISRQNSLHPLEVKLLL